LTGLSGQHRVSYLLEKLAEVGITVSPKRQPKEHQESNPYGPIPRLGERVRTTIAR
jgi:hypothetical protein